MNRRASRFVIALARWALMVGLAGVVLAMLAFIDRFRAPDNLDPRRNLLIISAVLLSLAFVLAPFVRRAFGVTMGMTQRRERPKTLLDEMREHAEGEMRDSTAAAPTPQAPGAKSALVRFIVAMYLAFGAALVMVLFAL